MIFEFYQLEPSGFSLLSPRVSAKFTRLEHKIIEKSQKKSEISKNKIFDHQLGMYDDAYQV